MTALQVGDDQIPVDFFFADADGGPTNLAGAAASARVVRTDGTAVGRAAAVVGDGTAGQVRTHVEAADAPTPGTVRLQARVVYGGVTVFSRVEKLKAKASL